MLDRPHANADVCIRNPGRHKAIMRYLTSMKTIVTLTSAVEIDKGN